jgi:WD40 repeat protein
MTMWIQNAIRAARTLSWSTARANGSESESGGIDARLPQRRQLMSTSVSIAVVRARGGWAFGIAGIVLTAGCGAHWAASGSGPLRLVDHWGTPTPILSIVGEDPKAKGHSRVARGPSIYNSAIAPGGRFALLHTDAEPWINGLLVVALPEGRIERALAAPRIGLLDRQAFALAPDGRWALFGGENNDVIVWDTERARELARLEGPHTAAVEAMAIGPDGRVAMSVDKNGVIAVWSMPEAKLRHRFNVGDWASAIAFSPDGRRGVVVGKPTAVFDVATGNVIVTLDEGEPRGERVAFTPDGTRVVVASGYNETMFVSDARTGRLLQQRTKYPIPYRIAIAPDGRSVLGEAKFGLHRWDLDDLSRVQDLGGLDGAPTGIGIAAGGQVFFTSTEEGSLRLWDVATGRRRVSAHARAITALAWTPDGATLAAGASDGTFTVWSSSGQRLRESTRHASRIDSIVISPDGKLAASVAGDGALWPLPLGPERAIGESLRFGLQWAAFSNDGQRVVIGGALGESLSAPVAGPEKSAPESCQGGWAGGKALALDGGRSLLAAVTSWGTFPHGEGDTDDRGPTLARWDVASCKAVWSHDGPARTSLAVSRDGQSALVADRKGGLDLLRLSDGGAIQPLTRAPAPDRHEDGGGDGDGTGARPSIRSIAFLEEQGRAMTGDYSGEIAIWDLTTGTMISRLADARARDSYPTAIAPRPGTRTVAVGTNRGEILIFAP